MKVILEPKATIIGKPVFIDHPDYDIPVDGDDNVKLGAFSAKACYDSFGVDGRPNEENQSAILEHRHGSVLEHIHYSLFLEGITRGLTLELNRHRTFNISQRSTRYTKEEDSAIVLEPFQTEIWNRFGGFSETSQPGAAAWWCNQRELNGVEFVMVEYLSDFLISCDNSIEDYKLQVEKLEKINDLNLSGFDLRKWARGKARNVLPHALETRGTWTNNIRGWRWFIESRSSRHAEPEIRRLADVILKTLREAAPTYFQDFSVSCTYDNIPEWVPLYSKV
jgi:thymidylate synthase (FAD)